MYYYDLDTCRLLDDHRQPAGGVACVRGSRCTMDVQLVGTGMSSYAGTAELAAKPEGNYTGVPVARTSVNVPATGKVSIVMPTLTVPMDTLLGIGSAAEKPYITLTVQLTVTISGITYISHNIRWVLHNSINRPGLVPDGMQYPPADQLVTIATVKAEVAKAQSSEMPRGGYKKVGGVQGGDNKGVYIDYDGVLGLHPAMGIYIGGVRPDGLTTKVDDAGVMSVDRYSGGLLAAVNHPGISCPDGATIGINDIGELSVVGGGGGGGYETVIYPGYEIRKGSYGGDDYAVTAFFKGLDLTPGIWEVQLNGRLADNVGGNAYPWYLNFFDIAAISKISGTTGANYATVNTLLTTQVSTNYNSVWRPLCMGVDMSLRAMRDGYWATYEPWAHKASGTDWEDQLYMRVTKMVHNNDDMVSAGFNRERASTFLVTSAPGTVGHDWSGVEISISMTLYLPQYLLATIGDKFRWSPFRGANGVTGYVAATAKRVGDTL